MNNFVKIVFACVTAAITGKVLSKAARDNAEETMRNKEALLKFATREQRPNDDQ